METLTETHRSVLECFDQHGLLTFDMIMISVPDITPLTLAGVLHTLMVDKHIKGIYRITDPAGNTLSEVENFKEIPLTFTAADGTSFLIHPIRNITVLFGRHSDCTCNSASNQVQ